jgi:hypothetical protein
MGPQASVQTQRPKVGPADPATVHSQLDAYEKHILAEHQRIQQARKLLPRPPAAPAANANQRGGLNLRVEKALKDAGA